MPVTVKSSIEKIDVSCRVTSTDAIEIKLDSDGLVALIMNRGGSCHGSVYISTPELADLIEALTVFEASLH